MPIKTRRFLRNTKSCSCSMPGVFRAVAYCEGVVVIFHSPRACAHVTRTMDINSFYRTLAAGHKEYYNTVPLLSSQLEEKHSIFGGIDRLRQCVEFAIKHYVPKCLVIANSCAVGVFGDDVPSLTKELETRYNIPVLTVDCYGFLDGEYYQGYYEITEQLVDKFLKPSFTTPGTVILLGDSGGPWGEYALELKRLLEAIGLRIIGQFPSYFAFKDLEKAAKAEIVVVLGNRGLTHKGLSSIAQKFVNKFHMKYLPDIYPVGWQQTKEWLRGMGKLIGNEILAEKVIEEERGRLRRKATNLWPITENKKILLCIGRLVEYFDPLEVLNVIQALHLNLIGIVILDTYTKEQKEKMLNILKKFTLTPIYDTSIGEFLFSKVDLVFTTHELQNKKIKQLFLPMLPIVGTNGEIKFMEGIYRCLCSKQKGGLNYV